MKSASEKTAADPLSRVSRSSKSRRHDFLAVTMHGGRVPHWVGVVFFYAVLASALSTFGKMDVRSQSSSGRTFARRALAPLGILCLGSFLLLLLKN